MLLTLSAGFIKAHDVHYDKAVLKKWNIEKEKRTVNASLMLVKNETVLLEDAQGKILSIPISHLSKEDRQFALAKYHHVHQLNHVTKKQDVKSEKNDPKPIITKTVVAFILTILSFSLLVYFRKTYNKFALAMLAVGLGLSLFGFSSGIVKSLQLVPAPESLDSAFTPFKPNINTFWDNTYFYVESKGIPTTHEMMVGISNHGWQQQVPIPQCYLGTNAWPIPLNPTMATNPIPVDSIHFTRGAIAIAANGVPIFNVHTNTGVDSYLDGQLDNYGGHCGRADDYHYHIAPLHLYNFTSQNLPVAYGLDGFPVFGNMEPDGSSMQSLDANHGHFFNGRYHYHGTSAAPYMIARMAGQVTEDATHQLIPQAAAHPVRPSLTPLNGALITACTPNGTGNGYSVNYTRNTNQHSVEYSWNTTGQYNFKYYTNGNLDSNKNFNGFVQCNLPSVLQDNLYTAANEVFIFPNPNNGNFQIQLSSSEQERNVESMTIYSLNGQKIWESSRFIRQFDQSKLQAGIYLIKVQTNEGICSQRFIVK